MLNTTNAHSRRRLTGFFRALAVLFAIATAVVMVAGALSASALAAQDPVPPAQDPQTAAQDPTATTQDPAAGEQEPAGPTGAEVMAAIDPVVELYVSKCSSCHSVGSGDRVGPDLADVGSRRERAWLEQMIQTPSRMLASDADARQLLTRYGNIKMPDQGLTDEQVAGLIDLILRCSVEPCQLAGTFVPVTEATELDIARGENLFLGHEAFVNGAVPCLSCHTAQGTTSLIPGGTLAMDLTHTYARLGDEGLDAALKSPAFLLMNKIYSDHPLDATEAFALRAFLHEVNRVEPEPTRAASLPLFGILGAGLVLAILNAFWARRLRGVRQPLTQRARTDAGARGTLS
jgi:mono/diheme cytochrome c family protein